MKKEEADLLSRSPYSVLLFFFTSFQNSSLYSPSERVLRPHVSQAQNLNVMCISCSPISQNPEAGQV